MDRSYLSDAAVVAASRSFVCVRLATYEDKAEGEFLSTLFRTRSGELENTVFTILAPDGKRKLTRAGRSPHMVWRGAPEDSAGQMAAEMKKIAAKYPARRGARKGTPALPTAKDVRRGLNIASCDNLPFIVVTAARTSDLAKLEKTLAPVAWAEAFRGRFVYASTSKRADLAAISGAKRGDGYLIIQPDVYGQKGSVLVQLPKTADAKAIAAGLTRAATRFRAADKRHEDHVRAGRREGVHWETEIPVTDPGIPPGGHRGGPPPGHREEPPPGR